MVLGLRIQGLGCWAIRFRKDFGVAGCRVLGLVSKSSPRLRGHPGSTAGNA